MGKDEKGVSEILRLEKKSRESWHFDETRPHIWCIHGPYIEEGYISHNNKRNKCSPFIVSSHHHHTYFGYSPREDSAKINSLVSEVSSLDEKGNFEISVKPGLKIRDDQTVFRPSPCLFFLFNKKGWNIFQFILKERKVSFNQLQRSFNRVNKNELRLFLREAILLRVFKIA